MLCVPTDLYLCFTPTEAGDCVVLFYCSATAVNGTEELLNPNVFDRCIHEFIAVKKQLSCPKGVLQKEPSPAFGEIVVLSNLLIAII